MIYDTETGQCRCLTTELLYSFSQKYPELKSQFGLVKIEMLSVYAFRDFAEALNTADEQEKLKAKQAEQQAAEMMKAAQQKIKELRQVTNDYVDDAMKRTEDAISQSLSEIRESRSKFRTLVNPQAAKPSPIIEDV